MSIFFKKQQKTAGILDEYYINQSAREALQAVGVNIEPDTPLDRLNPQDRKLVEIAKTMYEKPEMLIVDETTTALSHTGRDILYAIMQKMRAENKAVMFISHDLQELINICDRLVVLRDGKLVATLDKDEMNEQQI